MVREKRREAVLILVEDDDVLSKDALQQIHDISLFFAEKDWVDEGRRASPR